MFKISTKEKVFNTNSTIKNVTDMNFSLEKGSLEFACVGKGKIVFFNEKGKQFTGKHDGDKTEDRLSVCYDTEGHCFVGGTTGDVNVYKGLNWVRKFAGHSAWTGNL